MLVQSLCQTLRCMYIHAHTYMSVDDIHYQTCCIGLFVSMARGGTGLNWCAAVGGRQLSVAWGHCPPPPPSPCSAAAGGYQEVPATKVQSWHRQHPNNSRTGRVLQGSLKLQGSSLTLGTHLCRLKLYVGADLHMSNSLPRFNLNVGVPF